MYQAEETPQTFGTYLQTVIAAFALVEAQEYTPELDQIPRQEDALLIRTVGRLTVDVVAEDPGLNGVIWAAALIVMGDETLENTFGNDPADLIIHPGQPFDPGLFEENLSRMDVLQYFAARSYVGAHVVNPGGTPIPSYNVINIPANVDLEWDVNVKRRLKTDDQLWLLVTASVGFVFDPNIDTVFMDVTSRSLISQL